MISCVGSQESMSHGVALLKSSEILSMLTNCTCRVSGQTLCQFTRAIALLPEKSSQLNDSVIALS